MLNPRDPIILKKCAWAALLALFALGSSLAFLATPGSAQDPRIELSPTGKDDTGRIKAALSELAADGGGALVLGPGTFRIGTTISMPAKVSLIGQGCEETIILRAPNSRGQIMFRFDGSDGVAIQGLRFAYDGAPQFYRAIGFRGAGSRDVAIRDNCFENSGARQGRGDRWAIELSALISPSRNLSITGNRVSGNMQLTAGGGQGVIGAVIAGNHIVNGWANSIALSTLSDEAVFRDIVIERNLIENSRGIGIFIGPDQPDTTGGLFEDIRIAENTIVGLQNRFAYGMMFRAPKDGFRRLSIVNNILDGIGAEKTTAVRLHDDHGNGRRRFDSVVMCGNQAKNFNRGIWLQAVVGATIFGNAIDTSRPYLLDDVGNRNIVFRGDVERPSCTVR